MHNRLIISGKNLYIRLMAAFRKINHWIITSIAIIVSIVVLGLLVYRQKDIILEYQWQFKPLPILLSFLIFTIALFWMAIIWGWIINHLGKKLSYRKHIRYYIVSNLAKRIPGTVWYVVSRFQMYTSDGISARITAVASGVEIVLGTLAGILVILIFSTQSLVQYHISPIILIVIFLLGLLLVHPKVIRWIFLRRNVDIDTLNYRLILTIIFLYIFTWILGGCVLFEVGNVIYPISMSDLKYVITSWTLVGIFSTILFFSPSNFGITEIGLSLLLSRIVPSSIAVLIAITSRILLIVYEFIWAGFFLWVRLPDKPPLTQKD